MPPDEEKLVRQLPVTDDYMAHLYIPAKFREIDRELFWSKWFDYKRLTPYKATIAYMEAYVQVYKRLYARHFDRTRAEHITPFRVGEVLVRITSDDEKALRQFRACWRGRQVADALGMPYDAYIEMAFDLRLRFWKQNYMPKPEQLYKDDMIDKVVVKWQELKRSKIYISEDEAYNIDNYVGSPYQNDYITWLITQATHRNDTAGYLSDFVKNNQLNLAIIEDRLGTDIAREVEARLN